MGRAVLYVEAGGRGLESLADRAEKWLWDGEPMLGSAVEELLVERGFRSGPRRMTLTA